MGMPLDIFLAVGMCACEHCMQRVVRSAMEKFFYAVNFLGSATVKQMYALCVNLT